MKYAFVALMTATFSLSAAELTHRWSFNGDYSDSAGGADAVVDVAPDGKSYRLMMVTAADESFRILGAHDFKTSAKA